MGLKKLFSMVCLMALVATPVAAEELKLNAEKSKINFVGSKPEGTHAGGFKKFTCKAIADFENPDNGSLTIEIDADSLWSDNDKLTNHLKNPDFFDVRKYKTIKFESTKIIHSENDESVKMVGKMKMLDKTVEVEVPCKVTMDGEVLTLNADFKIDRTKWGMTYGEGKIDNDVKINAVLVFSL